MKAYELKPMLQKFLESDAGKLLIVKLGESKKYLRLACGERVMGYTPVYYIDGSGLKCSTESSALSAAFTGEKQDIRTSEAELDQVVYAIVESGDWCCEAAFMYWLEKCTAEDDGIAIPEAV